MLNFREPIYAALFKQISNPANMKFKFNTLSRRFVGWDKSNSAKLPALYQLEGPSAQVTQLSDGGMYGAQRYVLRAQLWAYAEANPSDNPNNTPSQIMHAMVDAIETAINPYPGELQQLGGLVENCFVEGEEFLDPGIIESGRIVVMVPVKLITGVYR